MEFILITESIQSLRNLDEGDERKPCKFISEVMRWDVAAALSNMQLDIDEEQSGHTSAVQNMERMSKETIWIGTATGPGSIVQEHLVDAGTCRALQPMRNLLFSRETLYCINFKKATYQWLYSWCWISQSHLTLKLTGNASWLSESPH